MLKLNITCHRGAFVLSAQIGAVQILVGILFVISFFIPFENPFLTFDSPEKSFSYFTGTDEIVAVIKGNDTDLVLGENNNKTQIMIVPRKENGWGVSVGAETRKVKSISKSGIIIQIFQYAFSEEYYICVFDVNNNVCTIQDNFSAEYIAVPVSNMELMTYYAYLPQYRDCQINVNGVDFLLN